MAIPRFEEFMFPLLRVLAEHGDGLRARDAVEKTAAGLGISEEERRLRVPSGKQFLYRNRIAWAQARLKAAGLTEAPRWGSWRITGAGSRFLKEHPRGIDEVARKLLLDAESRHRDSDDSLEAEEADGEENIQDATPEEQIGIAIGRIEKGVVQEIEELLSKSAPESFERVVLDVLRAMGYGAGGGGVFHVGGVGDGGIDGVITLDRLGLQKVGVQAKRWSGSVGRPEVQAFYGALAQRRAHHGVMITTGTFSKDAYAFAEQMSDKIVLVDGAELARLMIEHGVGVSHESLRVPKIDRDYFEEG